MDRQVSLGHFGSRLLALAILSVALVIMAPKNAAACCVDACFDQMGSCICDGCGAYEQEYCPWNPPCAADDWACRSCATDCRNQFNACRASCHGAC